VLAALLVAAGLYARARLLPAPGPEDSPCRTGRGNWIVATEMIRDHPWFGTGAGDLRRDVPRVPASRDERDALRALHVPPARGRARHRDRAVPRARPVRRPARSCGGGHGARSASPASVGAVAFLLQNLVDFTFYQPAIGALFVVAVAPRLLRRVEREPGDGSEAADGRRDRGARRALDGNPDAWRRRSTGERPLDPAHALVLLASLAAGGFLATAGISDLSRDRAAIAHELGRATKPPSSGARSAGIPSIPSRAATSRRCWPRTSAMRAPQLVRRPRRRARAGARSGEPRSPDGVPAAGPRTDRAHERPSGGGLGAALARSVALSP
jgi:hypothetical protein